MKRLLALLFLPLLLLEVGFVRPRSKEVRTLQQGKSSIVFTRFTSNAKQLVSVSSDATVAAWNTATGQRLWQISLEKRSGAVITVSHIISFDISADSQTIAISYWQSRVEGK